METIARAVVSAVELAESELRMVRRQAIKFAGTLGLVVVALICLIIGLVSLLGGAFGRLARVVGWENAAILVGIIGLSLAAGLLVYIKRRST